MTTELKPIRSEADHAAALAEVERLWSAKAGTPEGDRLDVLATLIDAYGARHHPLDPPDPVEAIKFRMEQQGLTQGDLEGIIGTRTRVAGRCSFVLREPESIGPTCCSAGACIRRRQEPATSPGSRCPGRVLRWL